MFFHAMFGKLINITRRYLPYLTDVRRVSVKSTSVQISVDSTNDLIKKSVLISQSNDVFVNLAMEHLLLCNFDFSEHHRLFIWKNDPCIVIGRDQNPWLQCNVCEAEKENVPLARRYSNGNIVYHDTGSLNLTFFTSIQRYDPMHNLNIIKETLFENWGLKSEINEHDIIIDGNKILTGAGSVSEKTNALYHCSLSVDVNKIKRTTFLENKYSDIDVTNSNYSTIKNLSDIDSFIQMDHLVSAFGWKYMSYNNEKYVLMHQQRAMTYINPTEDWFPGINKFISQFRSWEWNFGQTSIFTISHTFDVPDHENKIYRLKLKIKVENGFVKEIKISLPPELKLPKYDEDATVISNFCDTKYTHELAEIIINQIGGKIGTSNMNQIDKNNVRRFDKATL